MPAGLRVLITRPAAQSAGLERLLRERGAEPVPLPLFDIRACGSPAAQAASMSAARRWEGWIFTSVNAVRMAADRDAGPWPALYAIGEATAAALARLGHAPVYRASTGSTSEDLLALAALQQVDGHRFLICTGEGGRNLLAPQLRERGAQVQRLDLYRREAIEYPARVVRLAAERCDATICTSGENLERLHALLPSDLRARLQGCLLVVPSPRVIELARRLGFAEVRAPDRTSDEALVECLFLPAHTQAEDSAPRQPPR